MNTVLKPMWLNILSIVFTVVSVLAIFTKDLAAGFALLAISTILIIGAEIIERLDALAKAKEAAE